MSRTFGTVVLVIAVGFCLLTAWASGMFPVWFANGLGFKIMSADGFNEIRAQYACFFLAAGIVCAAALLGRLPRQAAFILLLTIFGGLAVGRLASLVLDGGFANYGATVQRLYIIDGVGVTLTVLALLSDRRRPANGN